MYRIFSALCWLSCALVGAATAQEFPSKPVIFTVPFSAGGPADVIARIVAHGMSKVLNQQFVVENTSGAGGTIGTAKVAAATPDGYSLLVMHVTHAANVGFYPICVTILCVILSRSGWLQNRRWLSLRAKISLPTISRNLSITS